MAKLHQTYTEASMIEHAVCHFVAVDAGLFVGYAGSNLDLSQASMAAYQQLRQLDTTETRLVVVGLTKEETNVAKAVLSYLAGKDGKPAPNMEISSAGDVEEGIFSALITNRPEAFKGKIEAHAIVSPHNGIFQRRFDIQ